MSDRRFTYGCYRCDWRRQDGTCSSVYVPASLYRRHTRLVVNQRLNAPVTHERACAHYQKHVLHPETAS